jgi:hypothetical protein
MDTKMRSKYSRDDRKNIVRLIENLKNDTDYVAIFDILMSDTANNIVCTTNSSGVCLNLSAISDKTLDKINIYLDRVLSKKKKNDEPEFDNISDIMNAIPVTTNNKSERAYKLSNYERNIIKQRDIKKILEKDKEYEELSISKSITSKKKKKSKSSVTHNKPNKKSNVIIDG